MMLFNLSILNPLIAGTMIGIEIALLVLLLVTRKEMRTRDQRRVAELAQAHDTIVKMQVTIHELSADARDREMLPAPMPTASRRMTINLHPRAEALRMLRRGGDDQTVAETLDLPLADVTLLRKVSQILCAAKE
jgi:hypothetical protein